MLIPVAEMRIVKDGLTVSKLYESRMTEIFHLDLGEVLLGLLGVRLHGLQPTQQWTMRGGHLP
jgi:hypothetical protein